jgi:hypothetical protein
MDDAYAGNNQGIQCGATTTGRSDFPATRGMFFPSDINMD